MKPVAPVRRILGGEDIFCGRLVEWYSIELMEWFEWSLLLRAVLLFIVFQQVHETREGK